MNSLVSKKYTKALVSAIGIKGASKALDTLYLISNCFSDAKFSAIVNSPTVSKSKKESLILSVVEIKDKKIINFIKILNQKNRLSEIPLICDELKRYINSSNNEYELIVYSSFKLDSKDLEHIKKEMGKRLGVSLYATEKPMDTEGVRLFVDGISVETSFLKNGFSNSLRNYILKAF
ncbi:hypothetical protein CCY99_05185 [Helicobacter sp. 16-1353]|uniref:F0F1 ATP synthase subunit delta n=1 Tax=Helicobacter sp. 16-1353 TaxID=2004996 RepID=UPI000DCD5B3F|nr:F0F1 ATP synthase subunit delta [Helicobacter sp. 16-1353]RAX54076.1 hypothetical protein CCY99_05185 [Helicobacter sp. 16-1353]